MPGLRPHTLGGQAVLEGVLMRAPSRWTLAVRRPDGTIHVESHDVAEPRSQTPVVRGVAQLAAALTVGVRAIAISARVSSGERDAPSRREIAVGVVVAAAFFVVLFVVVPAVFVRGGGTGPAAFWHNLREGLVRIAIFLVYVLGVSRVGDVRRVFEYHGAEHKVIAAYEAGAPRTREAARAFPRVHVRCGTDFLALVMIVAVVVFALVGRPPLGWRIVSRVALLPVVAGLSYEVLRFAARHESNPLVRAATWPGRALQRVTTREPDDDQLDVAIASLDELLREHGCG